MFIDPSKSPMGDFQGSDTPCNDCQQRNRSAVSCFENYINWELAMNAMERAPHHLHVQLKS